MTIIQLELGSSALRIVLSLLKETGCFDIGWLACAIEPILAYTFSYYKSTPDAAPFTSISYSVRARIINQRALIIVRSVAIPHPLPIVSHP